MSYKSSLSELIQKLYQTEPRYILVSVTGPPHNPRQTVQCSVEGIASRVGCARSKKEASTQAAQAMCAWFRQHLGGVPPRVLYYRRPTYVLRLGPATRLLGVTVARWMCQLDGMLPAGRDWTVAITSLSGVQLSLAIYEAGEQKCVLTAFNELEMRSKLSSLQLGKGPTAGVVSEVMPKPPAQRVTRQPPVMYSPHLATVREEAESLRIATPAGDMETLEQVRQYLYYLCSMAGRNVIGYAELQKRSASEGVSGERGTSLARHVQASRDMQMPDYVKLFRSICRTGDGVCVYVPAGPTQMRVLGWLGSVGVAAYALPLEVIGLTNGLFCRRKVVTYEDAEKALEAVACNAIVFYDRDSFSDSVALMVAAFSQTDRRVVSYTARGIGVTDSVKEPVRLSAFVPVTSNCNPKAPCPEAWK